MTSPVPDTRNSLILRLPDNCDVEAWNQFVAIYKPLIYRLARAKGFQDADAHEIVQVVLLAVSRAVQAVVVGCRVGAFRDWVFRIARNLVTNYFTWRKLRPLDADALSNNCCTSRSESARRYRITSSRLPFQA